MIPAEKLWVLFWPIRRVSVRDRQYIIQQGWVAIRFMQRRHAVARGRLLTNTCRHRLQSMQLLIRLYKPTSMTNCSHVWTANRGNNCQEVLNKIHGRKLTLLLSMLPKMAKKFDIHGHLRWCRSKRVICEYLSYKMSVHAHKVSGVLSRWGSDMAEALRAPLVLMSSGRPLKIITFRKHEGDINSYFVRCHLQSIILPQHMSVHLWVVKQLVRYLREKQVIW